VSTPSLYSRIDPISTLLRSGKEAFGRSGADRPVYDLFCMVHGRLTHSPLSTTPPINLISSSSAPASQAAASPTPSLTPATASSSSNVTSLLPIA
jgi:hypothetical protein